MATGRIVLEAMVDFSVDSAKRNKHPGIQKVKVLFQSDCNHQTNQVSYLKAPKAQLRKTYFKRNKERR